MYLTALKLRQGLNSPVRKLLMRSDFLKTLLITGHMESKSRSNIESITIWGSLLQWQGLQRHQPFIPILQVYVEETFVESELCMTKMEQNASLMETSQWGNAWHERDDWEMRKILNQRDFFPLDTRIQKTSDQDLNQSWDVNIQNICIQRSHHIEWMFYFREYFDHLWLITIRINTLKSMSII